MYGCELWNLSCTYVNKYIVAWRKIKRRLWRLPYTTHNNIAHNLSNDVAFQLDKRIVCFTHNALNHSNKVCRLLLLAKLHSISSTFATNYHHLCYKYELVQSDWHSGLAHLLPGKKYSVLTIPLSIAFVVIPTYQHLSTLKLYR